MASWTQTFSYKNQYSLTLTVNETSVNVNANQSTVTYSLVMETSANSFLSYSNYKTTISLKFDNVTEYSYSASRSFNPNAASSYSEVLTSGTKVITHATDGTYTLGCAASVTVAGGSSDPYSPGSASISGKSLTLTTIPRASEITGSISATIGSPTAITIDDHSTGFKHKLKFTVGSFSETLPSGSYAGTSFSWTPTSANYASQLPTQTSRTGTLVLYTYNGSTLIGSNSYSITLSIPSNWAPSVSFDLYPDFDNSFFIGKTIYVAGYTRIQAVISGTATTGAAIQSYTISGAFSKTVTTTASSTTQTSGMITTSGTKSVKVTITDKRGKTASLTKQVTYLSYSYPSVSALSYARGTGTTDGTFSPSDTGTDLKISFTGAVSLSGNGNKIASWNIGAPVSASGSNLNPNTNVNKYAGSIGSTTRYTVTVSITDSLGNTSSRSITVPTIEIPFAIDTSLPAIGVGAVPQTAKTLELASAWSLVLGAGISAPYTSDVLADALNVTTTCVKFFRGSGTSYTGDIPSGGSYGYGSFIVIIRSANVRQVIAIPIVPGAGIALNEYNGSTWAGWRRYYDSYVVEDKDSGSVSIAANNHATVNITITKTGYTPIGVVGVTWSGSSWPCLAGYKLTGSTNVALYLVNPTSSAMSATKYTVSVLYYRNAST